MLMLGIAVMGILKAINAPNDPPAAITPKTFEAPSPRNRLIITTQKIETTKKEYTLHQI